LFLYLSLFQTKYITTTYQKGTSLQSYGVNRIASDVVGRKNGNQQAILLSSLLEGKMNRTYFSVH